MAHELSPDGYLQVSGPTTENQCNPAAFSLLRVAVPATPVTMRVEAQLGEAYPEVRYVLKWPVDIRQETVETIIREAGSYFPEDAEYLAQAEATGAINSGSALDQVQAPAGYTFLEVDTPAFDLYWSNGLFAPEDPAAPNLNLASRIPSLLMTDWLHDMIGQTINGDLQVPLAFANNKLQTFFEGQQPPEQRPLPL